MKFLFEIFPVLLFFIAYVATDDIYLATGVTMVATVVQVTVARLKYGKVDPMLWVTFGLVSVLGALTLLLHDKRFIMWKPTALYWAMAGVLIVGPLLFRKNLLKFLFTKIALNMPEPMWARLNLVWVGFLTGMGFLNLYVAYSFSEAVWVKFKMFGATGLMFVFMLAQGFFIARYVEDNA